jgi:hypothetical protein
MHNRSRSVEFIPMGKPKKYLNDNISKLDSYNMRIRLKDALEILNDDGNKECNN